MRLVIGVGALQNQFVAIRVLILGEVTHEALSPVLEGEEWELVESGAPCDVVVTLASEPSEALALGHPVVAWSADGAGLDAALDSGCVGHLTGASSPGLVHAELRRAGAVGVAGRRQTGQLAFVSQSGRALGAMRDMHEIARRLLQAATRLARGEGGSIWLWEDDGNALVCRFVEPDVVSLRDVRLPSREGIAGWVAAHREPAIVADVGSDPRFSPSVDSQTGYQTGSLLAVPLVVADESVGVLEVVHSRSGVFDAGDLAWVQTLASPAALALENVRVVRRLARKNAELRERNDALDTFAHSVAHDLKRPLVSLVGLADLVAEDPEDATALVPRISRLGRIAYQIVEELLLLAQMRGAEVPRVAIDMAAVVAEVRVRMADDVAAVSARVDEPAAWPVVVGHGPWVAEVWANLLSNALKYGGTPPEVSLGADPVRGGRIRFWCRDAGPGLAADMHERAFQPFVRGVEGGDGVGLGLSVAKRVVERLGGEIGVESTSGRGATFWFTLPVA